MMDSTFDEQRAIVEQRQETMRQVVEAERLAAVLRRIQRLANCIAESEK